MSDGDQKTGDASPPGSPGDAAHAAPPDRVLVYGRIKPASGAASGAASAATVTDKAVAVKAGDGQGVVSVDNPSSGNGIRTFKLDGVFGPDSTQRDVYDAIGAPVLTDVLNGCRGCVLAYGEDAALFHLIMSSTLFRRPSPATIVSTRFTRPNHALTDRHVAPSVAVEECRRASR